MWTEERIVALKQHWANGLSASKIAAELGGVSRNAVISKVHRCKLPKRAAPAPKGPRKRNIRPRRAHPGRPSFNLPRPGQFVAHTPKPRPAPPADLLEPISRDRRLEDLTDQTCKFPHGDALPFLFCGAPTDGRPPYCRFHSALCFNPLSDRRLRVPVDA